MDIRLFFVSSTAILIQYMKYFPFKIFDMISFLIKNNKRFGEIITNADANGVYVSKIKEYTERNVETRRKSTNFYQK